MLKYAKSFTIIILLTCFLSAQEAYTMPQTDSEAVILLHGIARTDRSMQKLENQLNKAGYTVFNIHYPSRQYDLEALTVWLGYYLKDKNLADYQKIHFVTHSMGGLLSRAYIHKYHPQNMGRLVMLAPPNQGSELADILQPNILFKYFYGPAGQQLTTDYDLAEILGEPNYEIGIISGTKSLVPFSTRFIYKQDNDGMVSVESTKLKQAKEHKSMAVNHAFIMQNKVVIKQVLIFLQDGQFD